MWILTVILPHADAATLVVGGSGYPDFGDALAGAQPGDIIQFETGEYRGSHIVSTPDLRIEAAPGATPILVASTLGGGNASANGFVLVQGVSLTIRGVEMSGAAVHRIARVGQGGTLTLEAVVARNGQRAGDGGAIHVGDPNSALVVIDSTFEGNASTGDGGAIAIAADTELLVEGSHFASNTAAGNGGALWCTGRCEVFDSTFSSNGATDAGAIDVRGGLGTRIRGNRFCDNLASGFGAALTFVAPAQIDDLSYNVFMGGIADYDGGAVWSNVSVVATHNDFVANHAFGRGSAVLASGENATFTSWNAIVVDHPPGSEVIHQGTGTAVFENTLYFDNRAANTSAGVTENGYAEENDPLFVDYDPSDCLGSNLYREPKSPALGVGIGSPFGPDLGAFGSACTQEEVPVDGIDQNCDGVDDCYLDIDGDGYGGEGTGPGFDLTCTAPGTAKTSEDCNDEDPAVFPGAPEACDGLDADCDTHDGVGIDDCVETVPLPGTKGIRRADPQDLETGCGCQVDRGPPLAIALIGLVAWPRRRRRLRPAARPAGDRPRRG